MLQLALLLSNQLNSHRLEGHRSVSISAVKQSAEVRVDQEGILVTVAVRDGEGAEDEEDIEKQFEEDTLGEFLLLPTFPGCLKDAVWDRVRGESRGVCNQSISQSVSQPCSLESRGVWNQSASQLANG